MTNNLTWISEKHEMIEEARRVITTIKQMESSLDGAPRNRQRASEDPELQITFPLNRCLNALKEKQNAVAKIHRERFEQVKSTLQPSHQKRDYTRFVEVN